jgi:hypothetical protein
MEEMLEIIVDSDIWLESSHERASPDVGSVIHQHGVKPYEIVDLVSLSLISSPYPSDARNRLFKGGLSNRKLESWLTAGILVGGKPRSGRNPPTWGEAL